MSLAGLKTHLRRFSPAPLLIASLLIAFAGADARADSARIARAVHQPKTVCVRHAGASRQQCPTALTGPRLYATPAGTPLTPVLVGNLYAVDLGTWLVHGHVKFSAQWLDGHGHVVARAVQFTLGGAEANELVKVRACASVSAATSCVTLRLPERAQIVAGYLNATCGHRRPTAPVYDPNFTFIAAPQIARGWNPCRPITWAIDEYAEPPLAGPGGTSWQTLASNAVAQVAAATGLSFVQAPDFSAAPAGGALSVTPPAGVNLSIGFGPQPAGVDGMGGPVVVAGAFTKRAAVQLSPRSWTAPGALVTMLHELGHAIGLGHPLSVPGAGEEIMDPAGGNFTGYQPGDLCGLFEVTWQQPCAGATDLMPGLIPPG